MSAGGYPAGLIEAAGGVATVAALLGVGRATVYHWRSGTRQPAEAAQRLAGALATPEAPTAPTTATEGNDGPAARFQSPEPSTEAAW